MNPDYYKYVRREIEPLLPPQASRVLDVGCGVGATARWLKDRYPAAHVIGLEGNAALRPELSHNVDEAHIVDLNGALPDVGAPDVVLFLDVLEHLARPEAVLAHFTSALPAHGTVIVSLPNVAHLSVSIPLLLGRFTYRDSGIMDRTHVRFFVKDSVLSLLNGAGLTVERGVRNGLTGPRARLLDIATAGLLRDHLTKQYVVAARPASAGSRQASVAWTKG